MSKQFICTTILNKEIFHEKKDTRNRNGDRIFIYLFIIYGLIPTNTKKVYTN